MQPMELLMAVGTSALAIFLSLGLSYGFFRKEPPQRQKVLRFATIFSNAGFMGLPLVEGIVGDKGVIYGSFFIVVFNLICWTYGFRMMSGGQRMSWKVLLLNPGIIGLIFGLPIYFLKIPIPAVLAEPVGFFADLNTPLAMLVIGSYVAKVDLHSFISDLAVYKMAACGWWRRGGVPAVPGLHSAGGTAAGHQRHSGGLPGGGQHRAVRRAVQAGLGPGLQDGGGEHRAFHHHDPHLHHSGPGRMRVLILIRRKRRFKGGGLRAGPFPHSGGIFGK